MSNINYLSINENFPIPGQDNDTQVFRDNFSTIKKSLQDAKTELELLQNTSSGAALLNQENDFNNNVITNANFKNTTNYVNPKQGVSGSAEIDLEFGNYQIFELEASTTFNIINFPGNTRPNSVGKVTIELYSNEEDKSRTVNFAIQQNGTIIKKSNNYPVLVTVNSAVSSSNNPVIIEIWSHSTDKIFLNYLGQFTGSTSSI